MPDINPDVIRKKLVAQSAKIAFNKLNSLKPRWISERVKNGVCLIPAIEVQDPGKRNLRPPRGAFAATFDEAVIGHLESLKRAAQKPGTIIVVNASDPDNRHEYTYNGQLDSFIPRKP